MTESLPTNARPAPRRRPSLYRTVLSLAVAALVAAWLPFTVLYVSAINKAHPVSTVTAVQNGRTVIVTRTSTGQPVRSSAPGPAAAPAATALPVSTHTS